jgi:hypothetical protein
MKSEGKKIAAAVVYEYQMTKICERAGVDVLSVGDSLGRNVLGLDLTTGCRHGQPTARIDELAHIAGPVEVCECGGRFRSQGLARLVSIAAASR